MTIFSYYIPYIPSFGGILIAILCIGAITYRGVVKQTSFALLFSQMYEQMISFFGEILGDTDDAWTTSYVVNMFFVILLYNILGLLFDAVAPIFGYNDVSGLFFLSEYIGFATSDYHFNIAMATVGVLIMVGLQFGAMQHTRFFGRQLPEKAWYSPAVKAFHLVYEYVPFWGKDIITIEKGTMSPYVYYPLRVVVKAFDILISVFVGFLDIIGLLAKVVSLSFRLFGNMLSGTALLTVLILGLSGVTTQWLGFAFPLLGPIILFAQGLLIAGIQAFVFPLLIAIFLKVARMGSETQTT